MSMRLIALLALGGCWSYLDHPVGQPPPEEPMEIGPQFGETHVDRTEPRPPTAAPPQVIKVRNDLAELCRAVRGLGEQHDHDRLATALRSLADALFVVAAGPEDVARLDEHRRVMLAEIELLSGARVDSDRYANRLEAILDRAVLAMTGGSVRSFSELPPYNLAVARVAEAVRRVDSAESARQRHAVVVSSLRVATNALHIALGLPLPFPTASTRA